MLILYSSTLRLMTPIQKGIIELCIKNGDCSIADFSKELSVSVPTVTKLVAELISDGYLTDKGKEGRIPSV